MSEHRKLKKKIMYVALKDLKGKHMQLLKMANEYERLGKIFHTTAKSSLTPERNEAMSKVCFGLMKVCEMLAEKAESGAP